MKKSIFLILMMVTLALCGCSEERNPAPDSANTSSVPGLSVQDGASENDGHPSGLEVDVGAETPEQGPMGIYQAETLHFDLETLCQVLLGDSYWVDEEIPPSSRMAYYTNGTSNITMDLERPEWFSFDTKEVPSITGLHLQTGEDSPEPAFMVKEAAISLAKGTLQKLGLDTEVAACYPLNEEALQKTLAAFQSEYGGDPAEYSGCQPCYIIELYQKALGVPICREDIQLTQGDANHPGATAAQPYLEVMVTADGISEISVFNCIEAGAPVQDEVAVISSDDAVGTINKLYANIISTSPLTIHHADLQYAALPVSLKDRGLRLQPVWVLRGEQEVSLNGREGDTETALMEQVFYVDAVTGSLVEEAYR